MSQKQMYKIYELILKNHLSVIMASTEINSMDRKRGKRLRVIFENIPNSTEATSPRPLLCRFSTKKGKTLREKMTSPWFPVI